MDFEKDEQRDVTSADWKKENAAEKKEFDFDAFLADDLEERITAALDGRDLLEEDAFGGSVSEYVPRCPGDGEHGRHEAPEPVSTAQRPPVSSETQEEPRPTGPDTSDPRYAAPERPQVVVAEPRPTVYVTPPSGDEYLSAASAGNKGTARGLKVAVVVLVVIAILVGALLAFLSRGARDIDDEAQTPVTTPQVSREDESKPESTPVPADTPAPEVTPTAPPQTATHTITVTAGSGGTVSPKGAVTVKEGEEVTFTVTPDAGYELGQLLVDGSPAELGSTYRFTNVTKDHTLYAVFQQAATPVPEPTATPEPTPEPTPTPTAPPPVETEVPTEPESEPVPEVPQE